MVTGITPMIVKGFVREIKHGLGPYTFKGCAKTFSLYFEDLTKLLVDERNRRVSLAGLIVPLSNIISTGSF
jgi:hypothetical protein